MADLTARLRWTLLQAAASPLHSAQRTEWISIIRQIEKALRIHPESSVI